MVEEAHVDARGEHGPRLVPICGVCNARVRQDGPMGMPMRHKARGVGAVGDVPQGAGECGGRLMRLRSRMGVCGSCGYRQDVGYAR